MEEVEKNWATPQNNESTISTNKNMNMKINW